MRLTQGLAFSLLFASGAAAQILISSIKVEGNQRLAAAAIVQDSGLRAGQTVSRTDLDAAAQKLFETGLFTSMNYRYNPVAGKQPPQHAVTFVVAEDRADTPVRIEIPGMDEEKLWSELRTMEPLADRTMPHNDRAGDLYCRALERLLTRAGRDEKIVAVQSADMRTGKMETALMLANTPAVSDVQFEATKVIGAGILKQAVAPLVNGNRYSEREFRQILALNLRPAYEERGYLKVEFGELKLAFGAGSVAVTVQVSEGTPWTLGKVELVGDGVPGDELHKAGKFGEGKLANWKHMLESIALAENMLLADGYLTVNSKPARQFRDDGRTVDVRIEVRKGRQFRFGEMDASRLGTDLEAKARKQWKLKSGDPLNKPYTDEFWKDMMDLAGPKRKVRTSMKVRPDQVTVDVAYFMVETNR